MKNNNQTTFIASLITLVLLVAVIFIFFLTKNKSEKEENSILEKEDLKIEDHLSYNIPLIKPKKVLEAIHDENFLIVDIRNNQDFSDSHIESSINISSEEMLKNPSQLNKNQTIIFVEKNTTQAGKKIADQLIKKGYKINYLEGGLYNYLGSGYSLISYGDINSAKDRAKVNSIKLKTLGEKLQKGERFVYLDVRKNKDFLPDHFKNAINIPLENLEKNKKNIPTGKILTIDEDPIRSFQAAVRLHDMNILTVYYLTNKYSEFRKTVKNKTLLP